MDRHGVALVLEEIATLLDASGDNRFRARAFRTAARAVEKTDTDVRELVASGRLLEMPGIGPATGRIIEELVVTGEARYHVELRERAPAGMRALLRVPGLGPGRIAALHTQLGIQDLDMLEAAARAGRIATVKGFGPATQQRILEGIAFARGVAGRRRFHQAEEAALRLAGYTAALPGVVSAAAAGEVRRAVEIVNELVIVAAVAGSFAKVAHALRSAAGLTWYANSDDVVRGRFGDGLGIEVRLVEPDALGAALVCATGSTPHVDELRTVAAQHGFAVQPDGLFQGERRMAAPDEESVYAALGLQAVPPELREGRDEIALAREHALPRLVELQDLRGCFHCHTTHSDGTASVAQMAEGALALGWSYLGIADHSQNAGYAGGLSPAQIRRQQHEIDDWNRERGAELRLFKGVEADILQDGRLDYSDSDVLESMEYVIGSVHSLFRMDRAAMTRRVVRAVSDPRLTMLGHATGRLLLIRDGYELDLDAVVESAAAAGAAIEINADPHRLDLSWQHWPKAKQLGVRTAINPDAHSVRGINAVRYGINIARKAGMTTADVINAWPRAQVEDYLAQRKTRH